MSVLTIEEVKERFNNPDPRIKEEKEKHEELLMQVHGINLTKYLKKIEGLENETQIQLRKQLAISNKSFWSEILRPTDKIFKANGGSRDYKIDNDKQKEEFISILGNITEGLSLRKWIENYWLDKYITDPNGVILIENNDTDAYPTYKSILTIRDYSTDGQDINYIIFEPKKITNENEVYELIRVYDSEGDKTFKKTGDSFSFLEDYSYRNIWGKVPGVIVSDIIDSLTGLKKSAIEEQFEIGQEYLRQNTVFTLYTYHHGFPFFWMYTEDCPHCNGTGIISMKTNKEDINKNYIYEDKDCHHCEGMGIYQKKDVSDVHRLRIPTNNETALAPDIAGYVIPPIDSAELMKANLDRLKTQATKSHWGTVIEFAGVERTATEITLNAQPIQDRLNQYSDSEEIIETKLSDYLGYFYYEDRYKGSMINNGRNYIIKTSNELLKEYLDDKEKGLNETTLNDKLIKYYESLYRNDATNKVIFIKLIQVEPLVHNTLIEVLDMDISKEIKYKKTYYNEWLSSMDKDSLFSKSAKDLRESLSEYINNLKLQEDESKMQGNSSPE